MDRQQQISIEQELTADAIRVDNLLNMAERLQTISAAVAEHEHLSPEGALYAYKACSVDCESLGIEPPNMPNQLAFESFSPRIQTQLTLESISERVRQIFEMIRRLIARMIEKIRALWQSFNAELTRLKLHTEQLRTRLAEIEGRSAPRGNVAIGMAVYGIATERKIPTDSYTMSKNLSLMVRTMEGIRTDYIPVVMSIGERLSVALADWDAEKPEEWLNKLNSIAADYDVNSFARLVGASFSFADTRYPMGSAVTTPTLPGNRRLVFVNGAKSVVTTDDSATSRAARLLGSTAQLIRLQIGDLDSTFGSEMQILTPPHIADVLDGVEKLIEELSQGIKGRLVNQLTDQAKKVNKASEVLQGKLTEDGELVTIGLRFAPAYMGWAEMPYTHLLSHAMSVCRSHLSVASKHIKAYE